MMTTKERQALEAALGWLEIYGRDVEGASSLFTNGIDDVKRVVREALHGKDS